LGPGSTGRVLSSGHLVFVRGGTLWAAAFDLDRLAVIGTPVPVIEGIRVETGGAVQFTVADSGTLVYLPGGTAAARQLVWLDRTGREETIKAPPRLYTYARLSPDGSRAAFDVRDQENDIWIWDFARQTLTRLTFDAAADQHPLWMHDGHRLIFSSLRDKVLAPFWQAADGTGSAERLVTDTRALDQASLSPDGKRVVLRATTPDTGKDIVVLSLETKRSLEPLLHTKFTERNGVMSPDGRWLAYESNESGRPEVYVRPFPQVDTGRWQISTAGGTRPLWARNGRELFYVAPGGMLMSVSIQPGPTFSFGNALSVVDVSEYYLPAAGRSFDISPDGRRFLMIKDVEQQSGAQINVVLNWFEELQRLVPIN
jgi:serine/threonine-protein kinase